MAQTKQQAIARVPAHVVPRDCFVWYMDSRRGWEPIPGTGCARYVAHRLGISRGAVCDAGRSIRVSDVVAGMGQVASSDAQVGDVWTNSAQSHCGVVAAVSVDPQTSARSITIEHCSSGQGGVVQNDWATYFSSQGAFYRPAGSASRGPGTGAAVRVAQSKFPVREAFG